MSWTIPTIRTTGEKITDSIYNTDIVDNLLFLYEFHKNYACLVDAKATNTNGGTFTQGAWRTRDLNTKIVDLNNFVILAANQFILPAGSYIILASAPALVVNFHKARLQNITSGVSTLMGTSEVAAVGVAVSNKSIVEGAFTIAVSSAFEIQHYCSTTAATLGFGQAVNFAVDEIYTIVNLWKIV
jgi:hypothetical protein